MTFDVITYCNNVKTFTVADAQFEHLASAARTYFIHLQAISLLTIICKVTGSESSDVPVRTGRRISADDS